MKGHRVPNSVKGLSSVSGCRVALEREVNSWPPAGIRRWQGVRASPTRSPPLARGKGLHRVTAAMRVPAITESHQRGQGRSCCLSSRPPMHTLENAKYFPGQGCGPGLALGAGGEPIPQNGVSTPQMCHGRVSPPSCPILTDYLTPMFGEDQWLFFYD